MNNAKTTNIDRYSKEVVQEKLEFAVYDIEEALRFPFGMSVVDFHDLTNILKMIEEMIEGKPSKWALEKSNEFLYNMRCGYPTDNVKKMIHTLALKFDAIRQERDGAADKLAEALQELLDANAKERTFDPETAARKRQAVKNASVILAAWRERKGR